MQEALCIVNLRGGETRERILLVRRRYEFGAGNMMAVLTSMTMLQDIYLNIGSIVDGNTDTIL
eukprot:1448533-Prorocentrum_lima.AAC.1